MRRLNTKQRWHKDREHLLKALRDYEAGKTDHLSVTEKDAFVTSIKERIAHLNDKIARLQGKT